MSDGNFNRALLPSTPYRSGMKMGMQQMRGKAIEAFRNLIKERFPEMKEEELQELIEAFRRRV
ncbi:MAG: hypothetical protein K6F20_04985 [Bacteroidaceae bacterium]|nr:hypothetical protein [Bacteroidaceae bacterium]